jgi:hypothetical protein
MAREPHDAFPRQLASDNFAGVHPKVLERLLACSAGHARAYGDDPITARARAGFSRLFGREVATHFVFCSRARLTRGTGRWALRGCTTFLAPR